MKKRDILQQVAELRLAVDEAKAKLDDAGLIEVANKIGWLHERVDMLATKLENMRGNVTLDDAAAKRLTYQVGQFSARLDRLEQPRRKRPRRQNAGKPNGGAHAPRK